MSSSNAQSSEGDVAEIQQASRTQRCHPDGIQFSDKYWLGFQLSLILKRRHVYVSDAATRLPGPPSKHHCTSLVLGHEGLSSLHQQMPQMQANGRVCVRCGHTNIYWIPCRCERPTRSSRRLRHIREMEDAAAREALPLPLVAPNIVEWHNPGWNPGV